MTLEAMGNGLTAKNYIEGARVNDKFMRSQLKLSPTEFESYNIHEESAVTFSLKEFRSFLLFAESIGESITLNFNEAGGPIFIKICKLDLIECTLVMTTVYTDDVSMYEECRESEVKEASTHRSFATSGQKRKHSNPKVIDKDRINKKRLSEETTLSNNSTLFRFNTDNNNDTLQSVDVARNLTQQDLDMEDDEDDLILAAAVAEDNALHTSSLPAVRESEVFVTFASTETNKNDQNSDDDDDADTIPQSPQREHVPKLRSIFTRCFESTYVPKEPSPNSQVFVPNSDTED